MKFLPENRKKTLIYGILLIISLGGILYINFGRKGTKAPPASFEQMNQAMELPKTQETGTGLMPVSPNVPQAALQASLLPYGAKIDTKILKGEKFQALKSAPKVTVSPEELGNADPFSQ